MIISLPQTFFFSSGATAQRRPEPPHSLTFLDHTQLHTTVSIGLLWTSDRPAAETSTWQHTQHSHETDIHAPGRIRTRNPSKR